MYEIYNKFGLDRKYPSYYTVKKLYNRSLDRRKNLPFRIYDDLEHPHFENVTSGDKSIIYDDILIILEEFQLNDLPDEHLWPILIITAEVIQKKYYCLTYLVHNEIFKEVERYLKNENFPYQRLGKYSGPGNGRPESTEAYLDQRAKYWTKSGGKFYGI